MTLLRWQGTVEGHKIESLELLTDDENGLLVERTVAYRPFPALKIFQRQADRVERWKTSGRHVGLPNLTTMQSTTRSSECRNIPFVSP